MNILPITPITVKNELMTTNGIVQKIWNFCHTLRDDGVGYGEYLEQHYVTLLRELGQESGMLGQIFVKAQNKIQDPAKLYKLIQMLNAENWVMLGADVKGDIYEGLLEKNAERRNPIQRSPHLQSAGFLGHIIQQTAQFCTAYQRNAESQWPGSGGSAG